MQKEGVFRRKPAAYTPPSHQLPSADRARLEANFLGRVYDQAERATTGTFAAFLEFLCDALPGQRLHRIWDHAKIPHPQALDPYFDRNPALPWHFLPPCSPNRNNTERLWKWLKEKVMVNQYLPDWATIQQAIDKFLSWLPHVPDKLRSHCCRLPA